MFEYINGNSFFDLGIIPNEDEIKEIIRQMANIHKQQLNSEFIYDRWAIVNFIEEFEDKKQYLNERDYKKLSELLIRFKDVDMKKLPHTFTHGDIISTNIMKDDNGKLWIIDFADKILTEQVLIRNAGHINSESGYDTFEEVVGYL